VSILDRVELNRLYNVLDAYVVASRNEGGPQAILEACLAGCSILSTDVGHARDLLSDQCVYDAPAAATRALLEDWRTGSLRFFAAQNLERAMGHRGVSLKPRWDQAYAILAASDRLTWDR